MRNGALYAMMRELMERTEWMCSATVISMIVLGFTMRRTCVRVRLCAAQCEGWSARAAAARFVAARALAVVRVDC